MIKRTFAYIVSPASKKNLVENAEVKVKVEDYGKAIMRVEIKMNNQEISLTSGGKGKIVDYKGLKMLNKKSNFEQISFKGIWGVDGSN